MKTLRGIIGFEWRYGTRQIVFPAAVVLFFLLGFALIGSGYGPDNVAVNSPFVAMQAMGLLSLPLLFVLTIFCTSAVQRDSEHRMAEILYSTPVGKSPYLLGRFFGAMLLAAAVSVAAAVGMLVAPFVLSIEPARVGPVNVLGPFYALLVIGWPNLLIAGSVLFAVAALSRSTLASYVGAVCLYALYFVCALLIDSPLMAGSASVSADDMARAALIDPFGISAFFEQTRYWTADLRNIRYPAFSGRLLLNRVGWLAVAAAVLALVHRVFQLRVSVGRHRSAPEATETASGTAADYRPVAVGGGQGQALRSTLRLQLNALLRSRPFLALMALWLFVTWANLDGGISSAEYQTQTYPTTGILLEIAALSLSGLGILVVIYFSAELVWRERAVGIADIVDATPTKSVVFYLSCLLTLAAAVGLMALGTLAVVMAFQLAHGYTALDPLRYPPFLVATLLPLVLFAVAALLAQALAPNRYVGMIGALAMAVVARQGDRIGLEHYLIRYGAGPEAPASDLLRGGQVATSFRWFMLYWSAVAVLLALVTVGVWSRGKAAPVGARLSSLVRHRDRRWWAAVSALGGCVLGLGGFLFYQTTVRNRYETSGQRRAWKADYERTYRRYAAMPQPHVVSVQAAVDLYPAQQRVRIAGRYDLLNRTSRPIDTVWVALPRDVDSVSVALDGAEPVVRDPRFGMYGFRLRRPLGPGDRTSLAYRLVVTQGGVRSSGFDLSVVENGSFVTHMRAFPSLGYRGSYELTEASERRREGLPDRTDPSETGWAESLDGATGDWVSFETTVSTSADQVAVAPGDLRRTWRVGDRRYFQYATGRPINKQFAYVSARYAVRRVQHGGVSVEVYFHPEHDQNVDRMLRSATVSLDTFGQTFGPYPHRSLRIVEVPPYWGFGALALPGVVYYSENRGFLTDARDSTELDLITRRVAHEVGHQWWGHQVTPTAGPGATFIVESLAKYSEQLVLRRMRGEAQVARLLEFDHDRYLLGRVEATEAERPLARTTDQPHLYYGKGAVVLSAVRDLIGEAALNRSLHRVVQRYASPHVGPTSQDLLAEILAETPADQRATVERWMREVMLYDLAVLSATAQPLGEGRFRITARVRVGCTTRRGQTEVPSPVDEWLDVAVFSQDRVDGTPLYMAKHRFVNGEATLSIVVRGRPGSVELDPFVHRVEVDRSDNRQTIAGS